MLAEIHHKISKTGSNLSDRLEDKLTGDFFGTIRYLPFELGLKHVLTTTEFLEQHIQKNWMNFINEQKDFESEIEFWKREEEGEIDLLINFNKTTIGIEVKYLSGISSEDQDNEIQIDYMESVNQLARYSRMLQRISDNSTTYLLFLAPYEMMNKVKKNIQNRPIISPSVQLGFLCWQDILESLKNQDLVQLERGQQLILKDLQALLTKKGFINFKGFNGDVFDQPITDSAYIFQEYNALSEDNWNWPTEIIKENDYYVFNNY